MPKEQIIDITVKIQPVDQRGLEPYLHCDQPTSITIANHVYQKGFYRITVPEVVGYDCSVCSNRFLPDAVAQQIIKKDETISKLLQSQPLQMTEAVDLLGPDVVHTLLLSRHQ